MQDLMLAVLFTVSLVAGVGYIGLGLRAGDHLNETITDTDRSIGWLFWWSFAADRYNEKARDLPSSTGAGDFHPRLLCGLVLGALASLTCLPSGQQRTFRARLRPHQNDSG